MKNSEIHSRLPDPYIRDFLANAYNAASDHDVERLQAKIADLQSQLAAARASQAAESLAKKNDWSFFDVSDEIHDYNASTYFSFVGTEEEYRSLFGQ